LVLAAAAAATVLSVEAMVAVDVFQASADKQKDKSIHLHVQAFSARIVWQAYVIENIAAKIGQFTAKIVKLDADIADGMFASRSLANTNTAHDATIKPT